MTTERSANINIGGDEYTLLLTTKATKDIAGRYGGLENLGDKLMKSENFECNRRDRLAHHASGKPVHSGSQPQE